MIVIDTSKYVLIIIFDPALMYETIESNSPFCGLFVYIIESAGVGNRESLMYVSQHTLFGLKVFFWSNSIE